GIRRRAAQRHRRRRAGRLRGEAAAGLGRGRRRHAMSDVLLIANRGEIVTRVARSARALGFKTIAVASDADRDAPHTLACDAVVRIGGERPADSYLRIDKLIAAAQAS